MSSTASRSRLHELRYGGGAAQVGRYALIGVSGLVVDAVVFSLLRLGDVDPVLATVVSTTCATASNYLLHARFTFRTRLAVRDALRFLAVGVLGIAVSAAAVAALVHVGLGPVAAKVVSVPCVVAAQFVVNKRWSFAQVAGAEQ